MPRVPLENFWDPIAFSLLNGLFGSMPGAKESLPVVPLFFIFNINLWYFFRRSPMKRCYLADDSHLHAFKSTFSPQVYDLSASVSTPDYHYVLPGGKVRDATFINDGTSVRIAVMSSHGHVYTESMNESTGADGGAFFLTNAITVSHPTLKDGNGQVAGGGVSLYYSHVLKLMFFSYSQGKVLYKNFL